MRSAFFLLLLAVAALAQKDDSGDDGTSTADDSDGDATETTTQRSTKSKASSKPTESAQPNSQKCIVGCTAPIARQYGCTSMRDIPCICGSDDFVSDVENCLKKECTADQQASAMGLIKGNCGAYTTSTSIHATLISTQEASWANYGNGASHLDLSFSNLAGAALLPAGGFLLGAIVVL